MDLLEDVCGEWVRLVIEHGRDMVHLRMSSRYPATAGGTVVSGPGAGVSSHHGSVPPSGEPSPARPHRASASPDGVGTGPPLRALGSHPVLLAPDPPGGGGVCGRLRVLSADPTAGRGWHRWRRVGAVAPGALRRTPRSCSSLDVSAGSVGSSRSPRRTIVAEPLEELTARLDGTTPMIARDLGGTSCASSPSRRDTCTVMQ